MIFCHMYELFVVALGGLFACSTDATRPVDAGVDTDARLEPTDTERRSTATSRTRTTATSWTRTTATSYTDDGDVEPADTEQDSESDDADAQLGDVDDTADTGPDADPEDATSVDVVDDLPDRDTAVDDAESPDGDAASDVAGDVPADGGDSAALSRAAQAVCGAPSAAAVPTT